MKRKGENSCEIEERLARAAETSFQTKSISPVLREELRLSILNRRHANGQEDIEVEFKEPERHELTPAEIEKKSRRREQNRRAARKCREKKKQNQEGTFMGLAMMMEENKSLEAEISLLKTQKDMIQKVLDLHKTCLRVKVEEPDMPPCCNSRPRDENVNQTSSAEFDILNSLLHSCQMTTCGSSQGQLQNEIPTGDSLPQSVVEFCLEHSVPEDSLFIDFGDDMRRQATSVSSVTSETELCGIESDTDSQSNNSRLSEFSEDEDVFQPSPAAFEATGSPSVLASEMSNESYLPLDSLVNISDACEEANVSDDLSLMQYLIFSEP